MSAHTGTLPPASVVKLCKTRRLPCSSSPDISGFTAFVQHTAITHSQYIIAELLEVIAKANELGLELAEIEGDALLFYKHLDLPPLEALWQQARTMFLAFHTYLHHYEARRICDCEACSTAVNHFVVDLKRVDGIDSAGLAVLVRGFTCVRRGAGAFYLVHLQPPVQSVLALMRLDRVFESLTDVTEAVQCCIGRRGAAATTTLQVA